MGSICRFRSSLTHPPVSRTSNQDKFICQTGTTISWIRSGLGCILHDKLICHFYVTKWNHVYHLIFSEIYFNSQFILLIMQISSKITNCHQNHFNLKSLSLRKTLSNTYFSSSCFHVDRSKEQFSSNQRAPVIFCGAYHPGHWSADFVSNDNKNIVNMVRLCALLFLQ